MKVELIKSDNGSLRFGAGSLSQRIEGIVPDTNRWKRLGLIGSAIVAAIVYLPAYWKGLPFGIDHLLMISLWSSPIFGITFLRRNMPYSAWQPVLREQIAEVKVVADESRVKIGSRIAFGIFATPSREALVSVALTDGKKALFSTDREGLSALLAVAH